MYPTIYHALLDLFGIDWPWTRLLNSFGFFVALAFIIASYVLSLELKRKAEQGIFKPRKKEFIIGGAPDWTDILTSAFMGFIVGWKMIYLFANSSSGFSPQEQIFSLNGYWGLGILLAAAFGGWRYYDYHRQRLAEPQIKQVDIYPHHLTGNITFAAAIFGIAGAKLFHLLENPDEFVEFFKAPSFNAFVSGLTVYGGIILGTAGVLIYGYRQGIQPWHLADSGAPALILAYGIGRIGCQVSGDGDWGIANTSPKPGWLSWLPDWLWTYDYPNNVNYDAAFPRHLGQLNDTFVVPITEPGVPCFDGYCTHLDPGVFPTPVYETTMCVLIFSGLWFFRKKFVVPGVMFASYLILNGVERFFIEKIRVNNKFDFLGITMTQAELISVFFILAGVAIIWLRRKQTAMATVHQPHNEEKNTGS
jgi:prolipoprotein diacylglyceryltransferase